jgi:hypothetical protein
MTEKVVFTSGRKNAPYQINYGKFLLKGNPSPFDLPRAANGKFSPDGLQFVYEQISPWEHEFRNYRGENNPSAFLI